MNEYLGQSCVESPTLSQNSAPTDWCGKWFEVAKKRGENHVVSFGRGIPDLAHNGLVQKKEFYNFSHTDMDGISAMNVILKNLGQSSRSFPEIKNKKAPSGLESIYALRKSLKKQSGANAEWMSSNRPIGNPHETAVLGFSVDETSRILKSLASRKTNLDGFLLSLLDTQARELLKNPSQTAKWLFPINMRGASMAADTICNQVSFITLLSHPPWSSHQIQEQIKQALQNSEHWANWSVCSMGKYLGEIGMSYLSKRSSKRNFWMGTFSNLGSWRTDAFYKEWDSREVWFASPPGSPNYPLGFIHCLFNGKLSLSLKVHPFTGRDVFWANNTLQIIRQKLLRISKTEVSIEP